MWDPLHFDVQATLRSSFACYLTTVALYSNGLNPRTTLELTVDVGEVEWVLLQDSELEQQAPHPAARFGWQRARLKQDFHDDLSSTSEVSIDEISAIDGSKYTAPEPRRSTSPSFSNTSSAVVSPVPLSVSSMFERLLSPTAKADAPVVLLNWQQSTPVAGIKVYDRFEVDLQPIRIAIDYRFIEKLHGYRPLASCCIAVWRTCRAPYCPWHKHAQVLIPTDE